RGTGRRPPAGARSPPAPRGARPWRRPAGSSSELVAGQEAVGLQILLARPPHDLVGQCRAGRPLVVVDRLQVVAHELLVERRRRDAPPVGARGPVAWGAGGE